MKNISLQEVIDQEKGPIWVRNRSSTSSLLETGGDIFISMMISGSARVATVPMTWLPTEMTAQFPRKAIVESPNFMEAVQKGLIDIISEEDARKILAKEGAEEERQRLAERAQAVRDAVTTRGINRNTTVSRASGDEEDEVQKPKARTQVSLLNEDDDEEEAEAAEEVNARFKAWVNKINAADVKEATVSFRSRGNISIPEAEYFVSKCTHKSLANKVKSKLS
jgi:hypothetical protein